MLPSSLPKLALAIWRAVPSTAKLETSDLTPEKAYVNRYIDVAAALQNQLADRSPNAELHTIILTAGCQHLGKVVAEDIARRSRT